MILVYAHIPNKSNVIKSSESYRPTQEKASIRRKQTVRFAQFLCALHQGKADFQKKDFMQNTL